MMMNKNSNVYIIVYSTVMVVVVAFFLAFTAVSLKSRQDANILNEKQSAILASLGETEKSYDEFITAYAIDAQGQRVESVEGDEVLDMLADLKTTFAGDKYPVFQAADGRVVVPIFGSGLWGAIWGYVALEADMNTISGVVLDHASETPGLGAEIATAKHQAQYKGKSIFDEGEFVSITLVKGGATEANIAHEVDGISGGTKTADGVTAMFNDSLEKYVAYLEAQSSVNEENPQDNE
ncbi:MAG: NADH:ubiquinone reductase (Na(+)-transporting) subunit C [Rikenellaceae bacterium]